MTTNINADNGVVSGVAGLKTSADNSGVLALQTNGTTALTVNASQALGVGSTPSYGTSGQVLTSGGSSAAPTWTTVGGGSSQWTTSGSDIYYNTGNVGIGTATPDALLHVYRASGKVATFGNNVNNNGNYAVMAGSVSNKNWVISNNMIVGGEFGIGLTSVAGGTTIGSSHSFSILQNETIKTVSTISVGNATPSTSGAGITFPATQSASSDANTLDDYEEGTWTINLDNGYNSSGTTSYTSNVGHYTKIGRQVTVTFRVVISLVSGGGGTILISGLPFTQNTEMYVGNVWMSNVNTNDSVKNLFWGWAIQDNSAYYLVFGGTLDNAAMGNANCVDRGSIASGDIIQGTLTYFV